MKKVRVNRPRTHEFQKALDLADESRSEPQPLCRRRDAEFVHYSKTPSKDEARALCTDAAGEECPLMAVCFASARVERPSWGVRGGVAWNYGRQAHWLKTENVQGEDDSDLVLTSLGECVYS